VSVVPARGWRKSGGISVSGKQELSGYCGVKYLMWCKKKSIDRYLIANSTTGRRRRGDRGHWFAVTKALINNNKCNIQKQAPRFEMKVKKIFKKWREKKSLTF